MIVVLKSEEKWIRSALLRLSLKEHAGVADEVKSAKKINSTESWWEIALWILLFANFAEVDFLFAC